jgi:hypothetical protein
MNKIPTIKNCILKIEWASPNGSNPHSYEEVFSKLISFGDKLKPTPNKTIVSNKLIKT